MTFLDLKLVTQSGSEDRPFKVGRLINAGYVGRNRTAVQAHIDELAREGVPAPAEVPMIFPLVSSNLTTGHEIEVVGGKTSGEVEYVLLLDGDDVLVGIGSDHTDREVEILSIVKSKQVCANVMAAEVWTLDEAKDGWDDIIIRSWVRDGESEPEKLYQEATLGTIISAAELLDIVKAKVNDGILDGVVIFSGTVPVVTREMIFGTHFRVELFDPRLDRAIGTAYRVRNLNFLG
jgi:hypothetical protein